MQGSRLPLQVWYHALNQLIHSIFAMQRAVLLSQSQGIRGGASRIAQLLFHYSFKRLPQRWHWAASIAVAKPTKASANHYCCLMVPKSTRKGFKRREVLKTAEIIENVIRGIVFHKQTSP